MSGEHLSPKTRELLDRPMEEALGEPEQDIGDAAAKNDWGQELATRVKQLAEACNADPAKVDSLLPSGRLEFRHFPYRHRSRVTRRHRPGRIA
jgi:hypothetical protein